MALKGYTVDSFSAKDSLSKRDHDAFKPVLNAFQIESNYIKPDSPASAYKRPNPSTGRGAIHYLTLSCLALFESRLLWTRDPNTPNFDREKRIAHLDEADHIINEDKTQANFADGGSHPFYNFDEWVYRVAYDYYEENVSKFHRDEEGRLVIRRNHEIKTLCEALQENIYTAPSQSRFFTQYIMPALSQFPETLHARDEKLTQLLVAAHTAKHLQEGVHYCIHTETRTLPSGAEINVRTAKVLIACQISHGSTYSELVQQFLHTRLNKEAALKNEAPNFLVEPETGVVLSQNAAEVLNNRYHKITGCSATLGGPEHLAYYESAYGIKTNIKLPTHLRRKTHFEETLYPDSEEAYYDTLAEQIKAHKNQPILVTCKDDVAVKRIAKALEGHLEGFMPPIVDTNDSGKSEEEILPAASRTGQITFSARLSRGTDIKPDFNEAPEGLFVLRTYAAPPSTIKQEHGRTGRNGMQGICRDIISYAEVLTQYQAFEKNDAARLVSIMAEEKQHLEAKITKNPARYSWLSDPKQQLKYLQTRSVQRLEEENKTRQQRFLRRKESLVATLSGEIMRVLQAQRHHRPEISEALKTHWASTFQHIESAWQSRLANQSKDNETTWAAFFTQAQKHWQHLSTQHTELSAEILSPLATSPKVSKVSSWRADQENPPASLMPVIQLYHTWLQHLDGHHTKDIEALFTTFNTLSQEWQTPFVQTLITTLERVFKTGRLQKLPFLQCSEVLEELLALKTNPNYDNTLTQFEKLLAHPYFDQEPPDQALGDLIKLALQQEGIIDELMSMPTDMSPSYLVKMIEKKENLKTVREAYELFLEKATPQFKASFLALFEELTPTQNQTFWNDSRLKDFSSQAILAVYQYYAQEPTALTETTFNLLRRIEQEQDTFNENYLQFLRDACFQTCTIKTEDELEDLIRIAKRAKSENLTNYFETIGKDPDHDQTRLKLMQYSLHGYLNQLRDTLKTQLFALYDGLVNRVIETTLFDMSNLREVMTRFKNLVSLIGEIRVITTEPFHSKNPMEELLSGQTRPSNLHTFFLSQMANYATARWVNAKRQMNYLVNSLGLLLKQIIRL